MDCKIVWSSTARNDLKKIYTYYFGKSQIAANTIVSDINLHTKLLSQHPYLAAVELLFDDFPKAYRSLVISKSNYKVLYYVENDTIHIARVWDCRQNPEKLRRYVKRSLRR
jgi:plasmid stabilization system protein ParE